MGSPRPYVPPTQHQHTLSANSFRIQRSFASHLDAAEKKTMILITLNASAEMTATLGHAHSQAKSFFNLCVRVCVCVI